MKCWAVPGEGSLRVARAPESRNTHFRCSMSGLLGGGGEKREIVGGWSGEEVPLAGGPGKGPKVGISVVSGHMWTKMVST